MGLLTNPNTTGTNKILLLLQKHNGKIGFLTYILGLTWILFLANHKYNLGELRFLPLILYYISPELRVTHNHSHNSHVK
jgi:hypothetical protein